MTTTDNHNSVGAAVLGAVIDDAVLDRLMVQVDVQGLE